MDAYNDSEQRAGFLTMIDENLSLLFTTQILGIEVSIERIDMSAADAIVAICRRGRASAGAGQCGNICAIQPLLDQLVGAHL